MTGAGWDIFIKIATLIAAFAGAYLAFLNLAQSSRIKSIDMRREWIANLRVRLANLIALTFERSQIVKGQSKTLTFDEVWHKSVHEYSNLRLLLDLSKDSHLALFKALDRCLKDDATGETLNQITALGYAVLAEEQKKIDTDLTVHLPWNAMKGKSKCP